MVRTIKILSTFSFLALFVLVCFMLLKGGVSKTEAAPANWWSSSWQYRKQITVNSSQIPSTQTNFPILISVTDSDIASKAQADGDDIAFADDSGVKLSHEIERYTSATGELVAWVKVPSLSGSADTTIFIYYGNAMATSQEDVVNVWDSNFEMVHHLKETPTIDSYVYDSTSSGHNGSFAGSMTSEDQISGKIGGALDLDGSNDYINFGDAFELSTDDWSVSFWINQQESNDFKAALGKGTYNGVGDFLIYDVDNYYSGEYMVFRNDDSSGADRVLISSASLEGLGWEYIVVTRDGATVKTYLDGVLVSTETIESGYDFSNNHEWTLGARTSSPGSPQNYFNSDFDELRISTAIARSADWIETTYNNQNNPQGFTTFGSEEEYSGGGGGGTSSPGEVLGYAWSENIGWINFNCADSDLCATSDYKVSIDNETLTLGNFSGYAWSDNVGWISFEENDLGSYSFNTNCQTTTCTSANNCTACLGADNNVYGWAKVLSMGDDGWIRMDGNWDEPVSYNETSSEFEGWAWNGNSDNSGIGWISFNCNNAGESCATSNYKVIMEGSDPPTVDSMSASMTLNPCDNGVLMWRLNWDYNDDEGVGTAYQIIIDDDSNYADPIFNTGQCTSQVLGTDCDMSLDCLDGASPCQYTLSSDDIAVNKTYYYWINVWDEDNQESTLTQGPTTFTTPKHEYPDLDFTWTPDDPGPGEFADFTGSATVYGGSSVNTWTWTVPIDAGIEGQGTQDPIITFGDSADPEITLEVADTDGYSCEVTKPITLGLSLPVWREVGN